MRISMLDVGQGDAILIQCPGGKTQTLIDAGTSSKNYPKGPELFADALKSRMGEDREIEYAVNTHPHVDHLYGFLRLLEEMKKQERDTAPSADDAALTSASEPAISIRTFIESGVDNPESNYDEKMRRLIRENGLFYFTLTDVRALNIEICPGTANLIMQVPSKRKSVELGCPQNLNDCSITGKLIYRGISFLFLADVSARWEGLMLKENDSVFSLRSPVVKIGHHAADSTTAELLGAVKPRAVLFSTGHPKHGMTEWYGFPQAAVINRLQNYFALHAPAKEPSTVIAACSRAYDSCEWQQETLPPAVWSTAAHGTIDAYAHENYLCLQSSKFAVEFPISTSK